MEKFYAPTGVFRHGPISIPKEPAEVSSDLQIEPGESTTDSQPTPASGNDRINSLYISAEDTNYQGTARASTSEIGDATLPLTIGPDNLPEESSQITYHQTEPALKQAAGASSGDILSHSQNILFAEFANRWKRYLYPGQLAVMRALFELTFPHGTSECFTRYSELAAVTKMSRRNCINVMNSLVERGFVERLEIRNDASGKGISLRIHLEPLR